MGNIIITTTTAISGREIAKYLGVVSGECVLGTGFISETFAAFADMFGTETETFGEKLREAKKRAIDDMEKKQLNWERMPLLVLI